VRRQDGFALIEVLVALAIVSIALVPIFEMQTLLASASSRARDLASRLNLVETALDYMKEINPMSDPQGEVAMEASKLRWTAVQLQEFERPESAVYGGGGTLGLFAVSLMIQSPTERTLWSGDIHLVGWRDDKSVGDRAAERLRPEP
jgi:prepilin-type N-terminal cleavage/methylation domain-containing protein